MTWIFLISVSMMERPCVHLQVSNRRADDRHALNTSSKNGKQKRKNGDNNTCASAHIERYLCRLRRTGAKTSHKHENIADGWLICIVFSGLCSHVIFFIWNGTHSLGRLASPIECLSRAFMPGNWPSNTQKAGKLSPNKDRNIKLTKSNSIECVRNETSMNF